jgi:hypothetical protein
MEFTKVESSMIDEVAYQSGSELLFVRFKNGSLYSYEDVPKHLFDELLNSESKGKFFTNNIKKDYVFKKVTE